MKYDTDLGACKAPMVKCGALFGIFHVEGQRGTRQWEGGARRLCTTLAAATLGVCGLRGQDALNRSVEADRLITQTRSQLESLPFTARIKDLRLLVTPSIGMEWTDNRNLVDTDAETDWIFTPSLGFHAFHPIGEANLLTADVGVSYSKSINHPESDRLNVAPGTAIGFDFYVQDVRINLHNRLTYQLDPLLVGAVSGTSEYGGLENTLGVMTTWNLEKFTFNLGYDYVKYISKSSGYTSRSRDSHPIVARGGWRARPDLMLGIEATAEQTLYEQEILNDSFSISSGVYSEWTITERLSVTPRVGYAITSFSANALGEEPDDFGTVYFGLLMVHRPADFMNYRLGVTRGSTAGVTSSLSQTTRYTLDLSWLVVRGLPIQTGLFYEEGGEVASADTRKYSRLGGSIGFGFQITSASSLSLGYSIITKSSDVEGEDYVQNRVTLSFSYRF